MKGYDNNNIKNEVEILSLANSFARISPKRGMTIQQSIQKFEMKMKTD